MKYEYGYNVEYLNAVIKGVREGYESNIDALYTAFQRNIFDQMELCWFAPEAVTAARNMARTEKVVCTYLYNEYKHIFDVILQAGQNWASTVGTHYFAPGGNDFGFVPTGDFDLSRIRRDDGTGFIGIFLDLLEKLVGYADNIKNVVNYNMNATRDSIKKMDAFLGADQMESLILTVQNTLDKINGLLDESIELLKEKIEGTMTKYQEVARTNAVLLCKAPPMFAGGN